MYTIMFQTGIGIDITVPAKVATEMSRLIEPEGSSPIDLDGSLTEAHLDFQALCLVMIKPSTSCNQSQYSV